MQNINAVQEELLNLPNKPLVESIFGIRWTVSENSDNVVDRYHNLLLGKFQDKIQSEYPFTEALPSFLPEPISGYAGQYRFRVNENEWPLIQIGPGVITVNATDN